MRWRRWAAGETVAWAVLAAAILTCKAPAQPEPCPAPPDLSDLPSGENHWNHSRAVIGGEYPATGEGIARALRDGRDWLTLDAKSVPLRDSLKLHELTDTRFLVIEGPGAPHMTNIVREAPGAAIVAEGTWHLTISGLTLYGSRDRFALPAPMLRVQSLDRSRVEDMACLESAGPCMVFGDSTVEDGWVSASSFVRVEAERNDGPGIVLIEAADVHLDRALVQRNGQGRETPGVLWIGRDGFDGGTLTRSRFEAAGRDGRWGVEFRAVDDVQVWGSYFWLSHLTGGSGVHAYGNRLLESEVHGDIRAECNVHDSP